jgi:hypothetical protein
MTMTNAELIEAYEKAVDLMLDLQVSLFMDRSTRATRDRGAEARSRVQQMLFALRRLGRLDARMKRLRAEVPALSEQPTGVVLKRLQDRRVQIRQGTAFYAEAFYYFGHRATECLKTVDGFRRFRPIGVRDVRNHLIEHPKTASFRNFGFEGPEGVVVRPYRRVADPKLPDDRGLYANASEFVTQLLQRLATRAARAGGRP